MSPTLRERLFWVDLEMTGLDPEANAIVEVAAIVTEVADLAPLDRYHAVVHQPEAAIAKAEPVVQQMHSRSGLWDRVRASTISVGDAEGRLVDLAARWCEPRQAILAGNSVWQDRRFIERWMPRLASLLHYRQVDVSSFKVVAPAWFGPDAVPKKNEKHTALEDILESIAELEHYRSLATRAG